jgi:hypothetical protein
MILSMLQSNLQAQLYEDFSSPAWPYAGWVGDTANFGTSTGRLRIEDTTNLRPMYVAVPYSFLPGDLAYPLQFDFEIKTHKPTASNNIIVYIWGDSSDIRYSNNSLYLTFNTSSKKAILCQRVSGNTTTIISTDSTVDFETLKFSITKSTGNLITILMKVFNADGTSFLRADTVSIVHSIPSVIDFAGNGFFGINFTYTKLYFKDYYLDNVNLRPLVPDTVPPAVRSAVVESGNDNNDFILVTFNEPVDSATAVNAHNYRITTMPQMEQNPVFNGTLVSETQVRLNYSRLIPNMLHQLKVCNVKDIAGNAMSPCQTAPIKLHADDYQAPVATEAAARSVNTVKVRFSEVMDSITALNTANYSISGVNPTEVEYGRTSVLLTFAQAWQELVSYTLHVENVYDLSANMVAPTDLTFVLDTTYNNLIINEILFNPQVGGEDYVEIYNKSERAIPLGNIILATWDDNNSRLKTACRISDSAVIAPHDYCVVTRDTALNRHYTVMSPEKVIYPVNALPTFANGEGTVIIALKDSTVIDRLDYTEKMHNTFLNNVKGVSLERRSFDLGTQNESNWHSAAKSAGYGTPTYKNSQSYDFLYNEGDITVEPTLFSPDADGYNDVTNISYQFENCDYTGNIFIYDAQGRLVKRLERNAILGCHGVFSWDGTNEAKARCQVGNYVVYMEVFDTKGNKQTFKKVVTLMVK